MFKDQKLDRDSEGNIVIGPFVDNLLNIGFLNKGCSISVFSKYENSYIYLGVEGDISVINKSFVDLQPGGSLTLKWRPV